MKSYKEKTYKQTTHVQKSDPITIKKNPKSLTFFRKRVHYCWLYCKVSHNKIQWDGKGKGFFV